MNYCCGFLLAGEWPHTQVLLIRKNRPKWQQGLLNGIGGKLEAGETPDGAMSREFWEETGLNISQWQPLATLIGVDFTVYFFSQTVTLDILQKAQSTTDEEVGIFQCSQIFSLPVIPNLRVLVPLALDTTGIAKPVVLHDDQSKE